MFADEDVTILPGQTKEISTGIAIELPYGTVGLFLDKSSIGKQSVHNFAGVIDAGYRGELFVFLHNMVVYDYSVTEQFTSNDMLLNSLLRAPYIIKKGDKITQLVVVPFISMLPYDIGRGELSESDRGIKAFGSSGVK